MTSDQYATDRAWQSNHSTTHKSTTARTIPRASRTPSLIVRRGEKMTRPSNHQTTNALATKAMAGSTGSTESLPSCRAVARPGRDAMSAPRPAQQDTQQRKGVVGRPRQVSPAGLRDSTTRKTSASVNHSRRRRRSSSSIAALRFRPVIRIGSRFTPMSSRSGRPRSAMPEESGATQVLEASQVSVNDGEDHHLKQQLSGALQALQWTKPAACRGPVRHARRNSARGH